MIMRLPEGDMGVFFLFFFGFLPFLSLFWKIGRMKMIPHFHTLPAFFTALYRI